jgi:hypothetical protein
MTVGRCTRPLPAGTTLLLSVGFAGACVFGACSVLNSYDESAAAQGGAGGTSPTSSGSGGNTTSTSSGPPCTADLQGTLGTTAACESCTWAHCCAEAVAYLADQTGGSWQPLSDCTFGLSMTDGPCVNECLFSACGGLVSFPFYAGCNNCHDAHCCPSLTACVGDAACAECLNTLDPNCCISSSLYADWNGCLTGPCLGFCDQFSACG